MLKFIQMSLYFAHIRGKKLQRILFINKIYLIKYNGYGYGYGYSFSFITFYKLVVSVAFVFSPCQMDMQCIIEPILIQHNFVVAAGEKTSYLAETKDLLLPI